MYVKKIIIQGFKSFAHFTAIELSPGLNVVVGPNGSGKSNLIDALRWVWGDTARELRVTQNREVIFHGSRTAKPLGMADIEVWWEDSSGADLKVARRIFASGESEYFFRDEKIRFRDWKEKLEKKGLGIERLSAGVVGAGELQSLLYETPLERWQWLEMISGAGEWKKKLSQVSLRIEKLESRRKLLEERLKELHIQLEKWKLWAQEEEEYLSLEREWRDTKALYIQEMIRLHEEKNSLLKKEIETEEEKIAEGEKEERKWKDIFSSLSIVRDKCQREKKDIERERGEKEREKKKEEEKLYYLLTEMRENRKNILRIKEKFSSWERTVNLWEEREKKWREDFSFPEDKVEEIDDEELMLQLEERANTLRELEKKKIYLQECKRHGEEDKKKLEASLQDEIRREKRIGEEILELKTKIKKGEENIGEVENKIERGKEEEKILREKLEKGKVILQSISRKLNNLKQRKQGSEEWEKELSVLGWSRRAVQALNWFWESQNIKEEGFDSEPDLPGSKQWYISSSAIPPALWRECQKREVFHLFQSGKLPEENLVSSDGNLVFLRSGFLLFPGQLISSVGESHFYHSWKKREKKWQDKVAFWESRIRDISKEEKNEEEKLWKRKLEIEREKEKLVYREKEKEERERKIRELEKEIELVAGKKNAEEKELSVTEEEIVRIKENISQIQCSIKEREKDKRKKEEREREKERFLWEIQSLKKEIGEALEVLKVEEEEKRKYGKRLSEEGSKIQVIQVSIAEKMKEQKQKEEEEKSLDGKISLAEKKIQEIEKEKEERRKKLDKALFLEEKLDLEVKELSQELEKMGNFRPAPSSICIDIKELERSLQEKEELLGKKKFIPGAGEEFVRVEERFSSLKEKNECCEAGLSLVREGVSLARREIRKSFQEFLYQVNKSFSGFFKEIFPGGEAYLLFQEEKAEIEVRLPGKRKQILSLLSSGEKSLVALCFLFAVLETANLPFCFLDEVDANLDHANSLLLAQLLKNISHNRQVVVVTHQEEVMEVADRIIGMTMNEPGVSQAVCFDGESFQ
ncbi:MAG TPA: chromosome segregation SMC family protein [Candidatus Atribacteria bacterium]|nr:chromosome segregation SMC family protein [Candidatus Atribacteria bacterium]